MEYLICFFLLLASCKVSASDSNCSEILGKVVEMGSYHMRDRAHILNYESPEIRALRACSRNIDQVLKRISDEGYADLGWEVYMIINLRESRYMASYMPFYGVSDSLARAAASDFEHFEGIPSATALARERGPAEPTLSQSSTAK